MADLDYTPEQTIAIIATVVGVLLLLAPVVPPQGALFAFVALLVLGATLLWGSRLIRMQLSGVFESDEPDPSPEDQLRKQYVDGKLTEAELEDELEDVFER